MTQPTPSIQPSASIPTSPDIPSYPADSLLALIIAFLAPMFLTAANGDLTYARAAARETVNAYHAYNDASLLAIAQIIGFGLAALGSLSLAMADDLSLAMTLRLRANANACHRAGEQNRHALRDSGGGESDTPDGATLHADAGRHPRLLPAQTRHGWLPYGHHDVERRVPIGQPLGWLVLLRSGALS